jgi:hypothetical protein
MAAGTGAWEPDPDPGGDGGEVDVRSSLLPEGFKPNKESNSLNIPITVSLIQYNSSIKKKRPFRGKFPLPGPHDC